MKKSEQSPEPSKLPSVVSISPETHTSDWIGSMKGTFEILGDIVSPANEESDWGDHA